MDNDKIRMTWQEAVAFQQSVIKRGPAYFEIWNEYKQLFDDENLSETRFLQADILYCTDQIEQIKAKRKESKLSEDELTEMAMLFQERIRAYQERLDYLAEKSRMVIGRPEFEQRLAKHLKSRAEYLARLCREKIEWRKDKTNAGRTWIDWMVSERDKRLDNPYAAQNGKDKWIFTYQPEANASIFASMVEADVEQQWDVLNNKPYKAACVLWGQIWRMSQPILNNSITETSKDLPQRGILIGIVQAVEAMTEARVFSEYIEAGKKSIKTAKKQRKEAVPLPEFESLLVYPERLPGMWEYLLRKQKQANRDFYDVRGMYTGSIEQSASPVLGLAEGLRLSRQIKPEYTSKQVYLTLCKRYGVSPTDQPHKAKKRANFEDVRDWVMGFFTVS